MNQSAFAAALLSPDLPVPVGLIDPQGRAAPKRFSVYRNNVAVSLTKALEDGFPAVRKLVGDAFFAAMAGEFLRAFPPRSARLMYYGDDFAPFLAGFPPVARLGYLPDVARLEMALRESYHAADASPVAPEALAAMGLEALMGRAVRLAPSLRLVTSDWPIVSIWRAQMRNGPPPKMQAEAALILRPAFDPEPHLLPPAGAAVIAALSDARTLGDALSLAPEDEAGSVLGLLLSGQAIVEILP